MPFLLKKNHEASRWRVCYQWGLLCLVFAVPVLFSVEAIPALPRQYSCVQVVPALPSQYSCVQTVPAVPSQYYYVQAIPALRQTRGEECGWGGELP